MILAWRRLWLAAFCTRLLLQRLSPCDDDASRVLGGKGNLTIEVHASLWKI